MLESEGVESCGDGCDFGNGGAGRDGGNGGAGEDDSNGGVAGRGDVGGDGTPDDAVRGIDGLGGDNVNVDGHGREGGSEETSITSVVFGGSEDDLLGGEARRGGCGN